MQIILEISDPNVLATIRSALEAYTPLDRQEAENLREALTKIHDAFVENL